MGSETMMVVGVTLLLCLSLTAIHCNNTELAAILQKVHNKCPDVTRLYTLSEPSVQGVPLYVLEFSDKPGHHEVTEPEMKYIANTGEGLAGARVHVRNITRVERHVRMEAEINQDVTTARAG